MLVLEKIERCKVLFVLINICSFGYFLLVNYLTPLAGDDLCYQYIYGTTNRVENILDVLHSQRTLYQTWSGRLVVHAIDQWFLIYDKWLFDIANTVVFLMLVLLIYYCVYRTCISNSFLVFLYAALWFSIPGVGVSIIWQTMSCNYLWGSTLVFLCFTPYLISVQRGIVPTSSYKMILYTLGMFLMGFVSGWTIEVGGAMLLSGIIFVMVFFVYKHKSVYAWQISGFIGAAVGYAILILAPGNFARSSVVRENTQNTSIFLGYIYRIARETYYMIIDMGWLILLIISLAIIIKKNDSWRDFVKTHVDAVMMLGLSLIGVYVMTATAAYAERVLVTPIVFAVVAGGLLYKEWNRSCNRYLRTFVVCLTCIIMCSQAAAAAFQMRNGDRMMDVHTEYTSLQ